ncbi:MAG: substrate-binding domain-containing protein [Sphingomonas taxi]
MGALSAIKAAGLVCPRHVSVVGFDDIRFSRFMDPPLTTVAQPQQQIGREAVVLLLRLLGEKPGVVESVTLPFELIVRKSTAAPMAGGT